MNSKEAKGKKFYEMRLKGMKNHEVAKKCGELPYVVSARISEYRKKYNLPPIPRQKKEGGEKSKRSKIKEKSADDLINEAKKIRQDLQNQVKIREDGVKVYPKAYAEGYGTCTLLNTI